MNVSAATKAPRVFFRGLKYPEGLAAILTNPGKKCRGRIAYRGPVRDIEEVLTAHKFKVAAADGVSVVAVKLPAGAHRDKMTTGLVQSPSSWHNQA